MKKVLFLLTTMTCTLGSLRAQDSTSMNYLPRSIMKIDLSAFSLSSLEADYEIFLGETYSSLEFSPRVTLMKNSSDEVFGGGLGVTYRKYLNQPVSRGDRGTVAFYFYSGAGYYYYDTRKSTTTTDYVYDPVTSSYSYVDNTTNSYEYIHKIHTDLGFGFQFLIRDMVSVDMNLGGGLRYSHSTKNNSSYDFWGGGFGFTGITPRLGIAVGVVGKKKR